MTDTTPRRVVSAGGLPGLLDEVERLRAQVAAVRELAEVWESHRYSNGRPMLTTANVVDRLRAALGEGR